jgi:hypothetical protein
MSRFIRILASGQTLTWISQSVVQAADDGSRVLIKADAVADTIADKPDGNSSAVAEWADGLSQQNGLGWQRVGHDVLFERFAPP